MGSLNSALLSILFALVIGLVIYLFFFLRNIAGSVKMIETESKKIAENLNTLLVSTEELTKKLSGVTTQIDDQVRNIDWVISVIRETASEFITLKNRVKQVVEEPVEGITRNYSAIRKGIQAFIMKLTNKT